MDKCDLCQSTLSDHKNFLGDVLMICDNCFVNLDNEEED